MIGLIIRAFAVAWYTAYLDHGLAEVASGHLYEKLLSIMILSARARASTTAES